MSWLTKVFGSTEKPRTALDEFEEKAGAVLVNGYRSVAALQSCAPTSKTSDREIVEMYKKVGTAFRAVAEKRGERLPAGTMNYIVLKFFQVRELLGAAMVDQHLDYEIKKYQEEGLRQDYRQDLRLF